MGTKPIHLPRHHEFRADIGDKACNAASRSGTSAGHEYIAGPNFKVGAAFEMVWQRLVLMRPKLAGLDGSCLEGAPIAVTCRMRMALRTPSLLERLAVVVQL